MTTQKKNNRRDEILQALATMLHQQPGARITTAALAAQVGVSEAALYRHFPSKAKMYDALLDYIEEALFSRISLITKNEASAADGLGKIGSLVLGFAHANPGITLVLTGHAVVGENPRLGQRVAQIHARLGTEIRQYLRREELEGKVAALDTTGSVVDITLGLILGKMTSYVNSNFQTNPAQGWERQWSLLTPALIKAT